MKKVIGISLLLLAIGTVGAFAESKKEKEAYARGAAAKQQEVCDVLEKNDVSVSIWKAAGCD
jgi:hypothetical protein